MDAKLILRKLKSDNISGSVGLLSGIQKEIGNVLDSENLESTQLLNFISAIRDEFLDFAVIFNFCQDLMSTGMHSGAEEIRNKILIYNKKWNNVTESLAEKMIEHIPKNTERILLHSNSATITSVFEKLIKKGQYFEIFQTESRPMFEGREQAKELLKLGLKVSLHTDALVSQMVQEADMALLGADKIFDGFFVNKTGSLSIALACKYFNKPCFVLSDSRKELNTAQLTTQQLKRLLLEQAKPANEIWKDSPGDLHLINDYFEQVPNELITSFINEKSRNPAHPE